MGSVLCKKEKTISHNPDSENDDSKDYNSDEDDDSSNSNSGDDIQDSKVKDKDDDKSDSNGEDEIQHSRLQNDGGSDLNGQDEIQDSKLGNDDDRSSSGSGDSGQDDVELQHDESDSKCSHDVIHKRNDVCSTQEYSNSCSVDDDCHVYSANVLLDETKWENIAVLYFHDKDCPTIYRFESFSSLFPRKFKKHQKFAWMHMGETKSIQHLTETLLRGYLENVYSLSCQNDIVHYDTFNEMVLKIMAKSIDINLTSSLDNLLDKQ